MRKPGLGRERDLLTVTQLGSIRLEPRRYLDLQPVLVTQGCQGSLPTQGAQNSYHFPTYPQIRLHSSLFPSPWVEFEGGNK